MSRGPGKIEQAIARIACRDQRRRLPIMITAEDVAREAYGVVFPGDPEKTGPPRRAMRTHRVTQMGSTGVPGGPDGTGAREAQEPGGARGELTRGDFWGPRVWRSENQKSRLATTIVKIKPVELCSARALDGAENHD